MCMELNYTIGITTTLEKSDRLRKGDYIYVIKNDSDLPFEKVYIVNEVENISVLKLVNICSGEIKKLDLLNEDLENLQKLQLTDNVRHLLGIQ